MENLTFRSRLLKLVQKSRKAVRLYSGIEKNSSTDLPQDYRDLQVQEWKNVTGDLLKQLTSCLENPNTRRLVADVYSLRDRYYNEWRLVESELHVSQRDLVAASEGGDFTRAVSLAVRLVSLKARVQACQAAHHELNDVIQKSRVSEPAIELSFDQVVGDGQESGLDDSDDQSPLLNNVTAKVIPLRQKKLLAAQ